MRRSSVRRAFTLVEMLVVLAIVALLSALVFSVFSGVRESGKQTVCLSNQKQILQALQLYQEDAAGAFPFNNPIDIHQTIWIDALLIYVRSPTTFVCPSDTDIESKRVFGFFTVAADGSKHPTIPASYIVTEELLRRRTKRRLLPRLMSEVVHPASTIFLSDGFMNASPTSLYWTDEIDTSNGRSAAIGGCGYILRDPEGSVDSPNDGEWFAPNPRHSRRANVGFVDGHVKSMDVSQWYYPNTPYLDPSRGG